MPQSTWPKTLLKKGLLPLLGPVVVGARATSHALNILRNGRVFAGATLSGMTSAVASALAGDHPYGVALAFHRANHPTKPALIQGAKTLTYQDLYRDFHRASHVLFDMGIRPGDRVILMMNNCPEWVVLAAAVGNVGASLIPIASGTQSNALDFILENARPRAILCDPKTLVNIEPCLTTRDALKKRVLVVGDASQGHVHYQSALEDAPKTPLPPLPERDLFSGVVMYTSGTTGKPKGVERSESALDLSLVPGLDALLQKFAFSRDDICYFPSPLYHAAPLLFLGCHLSMGATVVLGSSGQAASIIQELKEHKVTCALLVPTMLNRMVACEPAPSPDMFPNLRAIFTTAAPLSIPTAEGVRERFGEVLHDFYGATETGIVSMASPRDLREYPGTVGRPLLGSQVYVVKDDGTLAKPGEEGELYARTALSMMGYRGNREATQKANFKGCFSVGDKALQEPNGYLYISGRRQDLIITGGVNVYPAEIEGILIGHPDISEVAAVGVDDADWGEAVHTVILMKEGQELTEEELRDWVKNRLSKPQQPKHYHFWTELPTSAQGKVLKRVIRSRIEDAKT